MVAALFPPNTRRRSVPATMRAPDARRAIEAEENLTGPLPKRFEKRTRTRLPPSVG